MSEGSGRRAWARGALAAILVVAVAGLAYWGGPLWALLGDRERLQAWVAGFGPWGPLVGIALNVAQVLLAPVPGHFIGITNGYLYGVWLGLFYSVAGQVLGRWLAMGLARRFGRRLVERLVDAGRLLRWDRIARRQGPLFFFLVFLFPFLPDDVVCFIIGLSPLAIPRMLVLASLGALPGVFVSCWVGAHAADLPWWAWIPLGGGAALLAWVFVRYQARLEEASVGLVRRLAGRRAAPGGGHDEKIERRGAEGAEERREERATRETRK